MYLSIDLGSTHFKAGVFDNDLTVCGTGIHTLHYSYPYPGRVELSIDEIIKAFRIIIEASLCTYGITPAELEAISITSQAQTFTITDERGIPKTPFISWQDERAAETCEKMKSTVPWCNFMEHSSFGRLLPNLQICILRHILESRNVIIEKSDHIVSLPGYLTWLLSSHYCIDNNLAAMSGLFSLTSDSWWADALGACGLDAEQLPEIYPVGKKAVQTDKRAAEFGLKSGIPIVMAGNDQTSGAFGAEIHRQNALLVTLGTAYVVYGTCKTMPQPDAGIIRGYYPHDSFYKMAADSCGGNVIDWAVQLLTTGLDYKTFFDQAAKAPRGCKGLVFVPEITSGGGAWQHIGLQHENADFARSVLESLARRIRVMVYNIKGESEITELLAAGGGSCQQFWLDILSEETGLTVERTNADPLLGAARMAR